jgi:hypothetical protein
VSAALRLIHNERDNGRSEELRLLSIRSYLIRPQLNSSVRRPSMSMKIESVEVEQRERHDQAIQHAWYSAVVPGLGQVAQHRYGAAFVQFGTAITYLVGAFGLGGRRALLLALFWNVWSIIDASRHEPD